MLRLVSAIRGSSSFGASPAAPLRRLLHKYELLCALSQSEPGRNLARRDALRAVAELYPAALREWDQQPAAELDRRRRLVAARLAAVEAGDRADSEPEKDEDWLLYGLDLHDCLRALLQLRRYMIQRAGRNRRQREMGPDGLPDWHSAGELAVWQELVHNCDVPWLVVTPELLSAVALPAGGRLAALAYQAVAGRHGVDIETIKAAIFGAGS
jgi:hypothetical protein